MKDLLYDSSLVPRAGEGTKHDHHIGCVLTTVVFAEQELVVSGVTLTKTGAVDVATKVLWNTASNKNISYCPLVAVSYSSFWN